MAAARVCEARCSRHDLLLVFHPETQLVSSFRIPVSKGVQGLLELNTGRHEYSGNATAIARDPSQSHALGGHLHMLWLSEHGHGVSQGLQERVYQRCQRIECNAEGSRKQRLTVAWKATVLTTTAHIVTVSICDLRLFGCNGKQLAFGTQVQET